MGQFTRNHHLHPCVNMLQCWGNKNKLISESLPGQERKTKPKKYISITYPEQITSYKEKEMRNHKRN